MTITSDKVTSFTFLHQNQPDRPIAFSSSAALKNSFDSQAIQLETAHNNLIDHLGATTNGDSGAHNIGSPAVAGLIGSTVSSQLTSLSSQIQSVPTASTIAGLGRQIINNGNYTIWQRGTSFSIPAGGQYTSDRWFSRRQTSALGLTVSRQTGENAQFCMRVQRDNGNAVTNACFVSQLVETANTIPLRNQQVTLRFRARASSGWTSTTKNLFPIVRYGTDVDGTFIDSAGNINGQADLILMSVQLTTSFQDFALTSTISIPASANMLQIKFTSSNFAGTAGIDDYFEIEQVQLTTGTTVLPFHKKQVQEDLTECKRYYQNLVSNATSTSYFIGKGFATSATNARVAIELEKEMRVVPTVTATASDFVVNDGVTSTDTTTITKITTQSTAKKIRLDCTVAAGLTQFRPYALQADVTAGRVFALDAEL